jgi:NADPH:quinone reductase-like Zn-dependent oxidoreductase
MEVVMAGMMKRWTMDTAGRDRLRLETVPLPEAGLGEILVKVKAVSLNFRDKLVIETGFGLPLDYPFTPASDMAGIVEAAGEGANRFKTGDRVISTFIPGWIDGLNNGNAREPPYRTLGGLYPGVLAHYVAFPEGWFTAAPTSLDYAQASTLPVAGLTAWSALAERGDPLAGKVVLVQGTGGVSLFGLQIAKACGAQVIVTSGSPQKLARAMTLGAAHGIDRSSGNWVDAVYKLTGDRGADHILEIAGGSNLGRSIEAAAMGGRISIIGVLEGFEISGPVVPLMLKGLTIQGIGVGHRHAQENFTAAVDRLEIKPVIDTSYDFFDLHRALDHLDRGPFGKVVVEVG